MKYGQVAKENYVYSKHGSCSLLAMIEPKTGKRFVQIRRRRRKIEFAKFMKRVAQIYSEADKITVVLDNLNTHSFSAFFEVFDAEKAEALMDRLEFFFTPKTASWLNMIEIEFSALSRQCLNRRASIGQLSKEVIAYFKERNDKGIKINWQFSRETARQKLNRRYSKVNLSNLKFNKT
jgi:hypothetical protein